MNRTKADHTWFALEPQEALIHSTYLDLEVEGALGVGYRQEITRRTGVGDARLSVHLGRLAARGLIELTVERGSEEKPPNAIEKSLIRLRARRLRESFRVVTPPPVRKPSTFVQRLRRWGKRWVEQEARAMRASIVGTDFAIAQRRARGGAA